MRLLFLLMLCGADFKRSLSRVSVFKSIANRESPEKERKIALLEKAFKTLERDMGKRTWSRDDLYD